MDLYLQEQKLPWILVVNKSDKLSQSEKAQLQHALIRQGVNASAVFFSARTGTGKEALLGLIQTQLEAAKRAE